jgi:hypothetical protein
VVQDDMGRASGAQFDNESASASMKQAVPDECPKAIDSSRISTVIITRTHSQQTKLCALSFIPGYCCLY